MNRIKLMLSFLLSIGVFMIASVATVWAMEGEYNQVGADSSSIMDRQPIPEQIGPVVGFCNVIAEGQFANQEGVNGIEGATWVLCDDGVLSVDEGFINWFGWSSPWHNYRGYINQINFTAPITAGVSLAHLFNNLMNVTTIEGLEYFDTSQVTNMGRMFGNASSLTNLDLSNFNTSQVTDMSAMFMGASGLVSLDLSNFDTSQVTNMNGMFGNTSSLTNLDLSNFNTSEVTDMSMMFWNASSLISLNLSNFDTSQVTKMNGMFGHTRSLTNLNLSNFDTNQVTDMSHMFWNASSLTSLDLSNFDTSQVTNMWGMFGGAFNLTSLDLSSFNTSQVIDMGHMFDGIGLTSLDLSNFDTSSVAGMAGMFWGARSLTSLDLSHFDTRNVTDMRRMFFRTNNLRNLTIGENFRFIGFVDLPEIHATSEFTGYWQNVGNGTIVNPTGAFVFTSQQLMEQFHGATMADTFVWQPVNRPISTPRDTLRELIAEAEARTQADYTPRSWANMQSMLTFARNVYNNPSATDAQIEDAINLLRARLDALEPR